MKIFTNKGYIRHVDELMSLKDRERYLVEAIDNIRNQIQEIEWRVQNLERKAAPTIDAVPVVRCGNCAKRGKNGKDISGGCPFEMTDDTCDPNAYCSYGVLSL